MSHDDKQRSVLSFIVLFLGDLLKEIASSMLALS